MRNYVLFLILISLVFSCKTKQVSNTSNTTEPKTVVAPPDPFEQVKQRMIGQWDWLKTNCCGRLQNITTPESTQMSLSRNYHDDYTVELFINDSLQSEIDFKLNFGFRGEHDTMLKIGEGHSGYLRFNGDTMVIDHSYMDLQTDWYVRRKK